MSRASGSRRSAAPTALRVPQAGRAPTRKHVPVRRQGRRGDRRQQGPRAHDGPRLRGGRCRRRGREPQLDPCEAVADEVRALGRRALAVSCHVGDWAQCGSLIDATVSEFGRIDVLVNNAGIAPVPPSLAGVTEDLFDKTIAVNLKGPLRLSALAAPHMPSGSTSSRSARRRRCTRRRSRSSTPRPSPGSTR